MKKGCVLGVNNNINECIFEYKGENFQEYCNKVENDFVHVKEEFPKLELCILPTRIKKEIFFMGELISKDILKLCKNDIDIKKNSLYIKGIYPSEFPKEDILVQDYNNKINWELIPQEHQHKNHYKGIEVLCTHHPEGEINEFLFRDRSIKILESAWRLYIQVKEYNKTKKWYLEELPHGNKAKRRLIKEKRYYVKR